MRKGVLLLTLLLLFISGTVSAVSQVDLVILHTNDMHGRIEPNYENDIMGMPYIAALVAEYREQYPHVWVMDAGDTIHGRPITDRLYGESTVQAMNMAGYDFMAPGNHDFNFGYDVLLDLEEQMEFQLLAANVYKDDQLLFRPYTVQEVAGKSIGIVGLATPDTYTTTHPDNIRGIEFRDMVAATQHYVDLLRGDYGVDMVIVLGHVGFGRNYPSTDITAAVSGIDLFVDGHSHTKLPEGEVHNGTLFVQAYEYAHYLGKVYVDLSGDTPVMQAALIPAAAGFEREPVADVQEYLDEARVEVRRRLLGN